MKKVLLVIDMLNDFLDPKGKLYCGDKTKRIIPRAKAIIDQYHETDNPVIFICDNHDEKDKEFYRFPKHCVFGTWGSEVIPNLRHIGTDEAILKQRYSGFYGTHLSEILENLAPDVVDVIGVCTSICVMDTVGGLVNRDHRVLVYKDIVGDFNEVSHKFALSRMEKIYGAIIV